MTLVYPLAQFELDMVGLTNGTRLFEPWLSNFTIHPKLQQQSLLPLIPLHSTQANSLASGLGAGLPRDSDSCFIGQESDQSTIVSFLHQISQNKESLCLLRIRLHDSQSTVTLASYELLRQMIPS